MHMWENGKLYLAVECKLINLRHEKIRKASFRIIDSDNNHQWTQKRGGASLMKNTILM